MKRLMEWIDYHEPLAFVGAAIGFFVAVAVVLLVTGCGSTRTVTVARPPNLGPARGEAHSQRTQNAYKPAHGNAEHVGYYAASGCGVERWAVKTATDPAANQINLTPQLSSVADIVTITPPVSPTDRVGPFETSTFRLSATLKLIKREADGDLHLGLEDGEGNTMIAESPDPACASGSLVLKQIEEVRHAIDTELPGAAHETMHPTIPVTVTGIGFMDRIHGQSYVARNGAELHPLTSIQFK